MFLDGRVRWAHTNGSVNCNTVATPITQPEKINGQAAVRLLEEITELAKSSGSVEKMAEKLNKMKEEGKLRGLEKYFQFE